MRELHHAVAAAGAGGDVFGGTGRQTLRADDLSGLQIPGEQAQRVPAGAFISFGCKAPGAAVIRRRAAAGAGMGGRGPVMVDLRAHVGQKLGLVRAVRGQLDSQAEDLHVLAIDVQVVQNVRVLRIPLWFGITGDSAEFPDGLSALRIEDVPFAMVGAQQHGAVVGVEGLLGRVRGEDRMRRLRLGMIGQSNHTTVPGGIFSGHAGRGSRCGGHLAHGGAGRQRLGFGQNGGAKWAGFLASDRGRRGVRGYWGSTLLVWWRSIVAGTCVCTCSCIAVGWRIGRGRLGGRLNRGRHDVSAGARRGGCAPRRSTAGCAIVGFDGRCFVVDGGLAGIGTAITRGARAAGVVGVARASCVSGVVRVAGLARGSDRAGITGRTCAAGIGAVVSGRRLGRCAAGIVGRRLGAHRCAVLAQRGLTIQGLWRADPAGATCRVAGTVAGVATAGARGARAVVGGVAGLGCLCVVGQQVMAGGRSATAAATGGQAQRHQQGTRREESGHAGGRGNGSMSKGKRRNFHGDEQCLEKAVLYRRKG